MAARAVTHLCEQRVPPGAERDGCQEFRPEMINVRLSPVEDEAAVEPDADSIAAAEAEHRRPLAIRGEVRHRIDGRARTATIGREIEITVLVHAGRLPAHRRARLAGDGPCRVGVLLGWLGLVHVLGIRPGDPPAGLEERVEPARVEPGRTGVGIVGSRAVPALGEQPPARTQGRGSSGFRRAAAARSARARSRKPSVSNARRDRSRGHVVGRSRDSGSELGLGLLSFVQPPERISPEEPQGPQLGGRLVEHGIRFAGGAGRLGAHQVAIGAAGAVHRRRRGHRGCTARGRVPAPGASALPARPGRRGRGSGRRPPCRSCSAHSSQDGEGLCAAAGAEQGVAQHDSIP